MKVPMNQTIKIFTTVIIAGLTAVTLFTSCGGKSNMTPVKKGDAVLFSGGIGGSESGTKTAYANDNASDRSKAENINWLSGDLIRIWSAECSEPAGMGVYGPSADYSVSVNTDKTKGKITVLPNTIGLRWGEPETTHHFYAVYPSPATKDTSAGIDKSSDSGSFATEAGGQFTFTGHIPQNQKIASYDASTSIAYPDMTNLYMAAKADASQEQDGSGIFLSFTPLSTAIQFVITNAMTADKTMKVKKVSLISDPKTGSKKNLSGTFNSILSGTWTKPDSNYGKTYPPCSEPASGNSTEVSIDFTGTAAFNPGIANGSTLTFTFFLLPAQTLDNLSFVICKQDGEGETVIKTRLSMADGTGIPFPVHKKTYVKGILVPDGAKWTVQYSLDVNEWDDAGETPAPFHGPQVVEIATMTEWEDVDISIELE